MAHQNLNQYIRYDLCRALVEKATAASERDMNIREGEVFRAVRDEFLGEHKEAFESLPDYMVYTDESFYTDYTRIANYVSKDGKVFKERVKVPPNLGPSRMGRDSEAYQAFKSFAQDKKAFEEAESKLRSDINGALSAIRTTKKLKTDFPEAYEVYVERYGDPESFEKKKLPVPSVASVRGQMSAFKVPFKGKKEAA